MDREFVPMSDSTFEFETSRKAMRSRDELINFGYL